MVDPDLLLALVLVLLLVVLLVVLSQCPAGPA
jgi:hypothetical protein